MLNSKVVTFSFLILGFMLIEMPEFIKTGSDSDGYDYNNIDNNYIYDENNPYDRKKYRDDDGYNTDDYKEEDNEGESSKAYPDFNLEKGKKALIAMLEDIENNYLYFDSDDSEDDRKRPNLESIKAATDVDDLISAGNHCLSNDQDQEIVHSNTDDLVELRDKLLRFLNSFEKKLQASGYRDTKGPLTYLYARLEKKLKDGNDDDEEDDSD